MPISPRGQSAEAAEFLKGKVPPEAALGLEHAHFLIASRLAATCPEAVDRALDGLRSPWLWRAWLEFPGGADLKSRVERTMSAVEGRGPAAVASLHAAVIAEDAAAIATALALAKDLPAPVRDYAAVRA
jgi:hypothetical protein